MGIASIGSPRGAIKRARASRWIALLLGVSCGAAFLGDPSLAASPAESSIGPGKPSVTWEGPYRNLPTTENPFMTDDFALAVDVPADHWIGNEGGVNITIEWPDDDDYFELQVHDAEGGSAGATGNGSAPPPRNTQTLYIPEASGKYRVTAIYTAVVDSGYTGLASFSSEPKEGGPPVVFEPGDGLAFAPATVVSAHFLGTEPMMTMERRVEGSRAAVDADRIFVDWPLSGRTQVGQLSRSEDGGDSFRLLFDPTCAQRSRPNCATGGGGDTVTDVNLIDGTLYFSDQEVVVGNEGLASSTDHGDSFPVERQHVISNSTSATDRQWLASAGDAVKLPAGTDIGAFLSYHVPLTGQYIQGIVRSSDRTDGRPLPQPAPQVPLVIQSGPLRVDTTSGPGRGWLYQPYFSFQTADLEVATADGAEYHKPTAWEAVSVFPDWSPGSPFPWFELDARGNAYLLWVTDRGELFYSASAIDDDANNPDKPGGRPGKVWTEPARVALPGIGSVAFPEIVGGDAGRVAITYLGTPDHNGRPADAPVGAQWHAYAAVITNALQRGGPARVTTGRVSHRPVHSDEICTTGPSCLSSGDRSLTDMIDIGYDQDGRVAVVFTDNNSGFGNQVSGPSTPFDKARPFAHFAKQTSGPSLLAGKDVAVGVLSGHVTDHSGDATWPNTAEGALLPSLDARALSIRAESDEIVARLTLGNAGFMARDLDAHNDARDKQGRAYPDAERLQYIVRVTTDRDIYHLSARSLGDGGPLAFFGGVLGANDALRNPDDTILGAAYKADAGFRVTGSLQGDTLVLRAPLSALGLASGGPIYSATAFTTAGPRAKDESLVDPMRTIDATPPFDAVLPAAVAPTPTPSPTLTASATPTPTPTTSATPTPTPTPTAVAGPAEPASVVVTPAEAKSSPRTTHEVTALVTDEFGAPVPGAAVEWSSSGVGDISSRESATGDDGWATAMLSSNEVGDQVITATATRCAEGASCTATAMKHWGPERCDVFGTRGNDLLTGTGTGEVICGFGGNDVILGRGGNDVLLGGLGSDRLFGGRGRDLIRGRPGDDEARGGRGSDRIFGGRGDDRLVGGPGRDRLRGGPGRDSFDQ